MSKLILPDSEPVKAELLVPTRRGFMRNLSAAFTGLLVAPVIIKAENLMHIDSPANRLIWAFMKRYEYEKSCEYAGWTDSGINASQNWNDDFLQLWKRRNQELHYELKRFAEITHHRDEVEKRGIFNQHVRYFDREKYSGLWIPSPKKATLIT